MTAVAARPVRPSRLGVAARVALGAVVSVLGAAVKPHRASLARLTEIPLTVAGFGCVNAGVFLANSVAGWVITGVSLMVLEHLIADPE